MLRRVPLFSSAGDAGRRLRLPGKNKHINQQTAISYIKLRQPKHNKLKKASPARYQEVLKHMKAHTPTHEGGYVLNGQDSGRVRGSDCSLEYKRNYNYVCVYIHIYIYIYTCIIILSCIMISLSLYIYIYIHIMLLYIYIYTYIYMYIYIYICIHSFRHWGSRTRFRKAGTGPPARKPFQGCTFRIVTVLIEYQPNSNQVLF